MQEVYAVTSRVEQEASEQENINSEVIMANKETWIVYKVESMSAEGWRERKLMPSGGLTEMLTEEWDFSGKLPQIGDRVREYVNLEDPDNGITHGKDGDWIVTRINHFSSQETNQEIAVCYCAYQPIESNWVELKRGRPVNEILQPAEVG